MEKNFLAGSDAVAYLSDQCTKNISHLFGAIPVVRTYLMTDFWPRWYSAHIYAEYGDDKFDLSYNIISL